MPDAEPNPRLERVQFSLRATGVKPNVRNPLRSGVHSRGYLPHVKREGASYFVTFRLADSLPKDVLMKFQAERAEKLQRHFASKKLSPQKRKNTAVETIEDIERDYRRKIERYLDTGVGQCFLRRPEVADLVAGAFRHFEGPRYYLHAWVVMPNHAHVAFWPMPNELVSEIVKSWKGYTARQANELLNHVGQPFWQKEPYDHWIRDEDEKARICQYVTNNPVKARLCGTPEQWRWSSAWRGNRGAGKAG